MLTILYRHKRMRGGLGRSDSGQEENYLPRSVCNNVTKEGEGWDLANPKKKNKGKEKEGGS